ncbi:hypothetical protein KIN20_014094 [Parelaphostrongylus tenuis]|uniref:Uncharacterized protein n=1 Tax=Parelaphostrongylus tenuis TaxID=148309 RepID=A0AAD5MHT0_PARTN|nr:hypothetical protein KIN20_014094 [Parelaphostrongylus tenuis]
MGRRKQVSPQECSKMRPTSVRQVREEKKRRLNPLAFIYSSPNSECEIRGTHGQPTDSESSRQDYTALKRAFAETPATSN